MATLVKEKRKEKKKSKVKNAVKPLEEHSLEETCFREAIDEVNIHTESSLPEISSTIDEVFNESIPEENVRPEASDGDNTSCVEKNLLDELGLNVAKMEICDKNIEIEKEISTEENSNIVQALPNFNVTKTATGLDFNEIGNTYYDLNNRLQRIQIPTQEIHNVQEKPINEIENNDIENVDENTMPSAPLLDVAEIKQTAQITQSNIDGIKVKKPKVACMPLEEAIRIFGGREMAEVKAMSDREEMAVEAGPLSGPEHPLVDLLTTFRSSLSALERERITINCGFIEEEKRRELLWRVEKKSITISEKCPCGANVDLRAVYDHAELQKDRLPVAKLRLEGLLRDIQECYCHHQHAALLAHFRIEELISETIKSNKGEIREALTLILQALRLSDGVSAVFPEALQRWAAVLADALVDERDLRQLLFVVHHLFRQSRSVQWAGRAMRMRVSDTSSAATLVAFLDVLLSRPSLDNATECTEDLDAWEEVDVKGDGGAVEEGRLRERDLLMLINSLPLRDLVARIVLFMRVDLSDSGSWGDASGGLGVRKACCGVRALLRVSRAPHRYARLRARMRGLAAAALRALAALHMRSSPTYSMDLEDSIQAELEACFAAGVTIMGEELHRLPATLLTEDTAREYCLAFQSLHDKTPQHIETLGIETPVLSCDVRVRIVTQVAIDRECDHELARHVLDFLFQTGIKHKPSTVKCGCIESARTELDRLLDVHPYLHTIVFHIFADNTHGDSDASLVRHLCVTKWRPTTGEIRSVLDNWTERCPQLIQYLLLDLDYTPHSGVSLESQLFIGWWLYNFVPDAPEWAWAVMRSLRLHRSHWSLPLDAPPLDKPPETLLGSMYAILGTDWGHCVPLACGAGAEALYRLAASRPLEAVHCLGRLVTVLASSPESISLTPRFADAITAILNWGPNLVQRALGRGGPGGADALQACVLRQLRDMKSHVEYRSALLTAWMHALWPVSGSSRAILDAAVRATRDWDALDRYVAVLLQDKNSKRHIDESVRLAGSAPHVCESVLRRALHAELARGLAARLLPRLHAQRRDAARVHVDHALKQAGSSMTSDDLVIHKTAAAVLTAPSTNPAHLTLWRLFFHIYLQRPPTNNVETTPPVGPLFFSGLVKSRTLAQLKKRLQDAISYHHNEIEALKNKQSIDTPDTSIRTIEKAPTSDMFPQLSIIDMVEESSDESNDEEGEVNNVEVNEITADDNSGLLAYHVGAERLLREYFRWLEEGERVRAWPHHADLSRFIPEQALSSAWSASVPQCAEQNRTAAPPPARAPTTHHERALLAIRDISDRTHHRRKKLTVKSLVEDVNFMDSRAVLKSIDLRLGEVVDFAREWTSEVSRISQLDSKLWELVGKLRVRRPLPPVKKSCPQNCRPITIRIAEDEWYISTGVEREIQENRRASRAGVRRLCRARPHFARTAAALLACAEQTRNAETAVCVCERVWRYLPLVHACSHAKELLTNLVTELAEKWICHDSRRTVELLSRWSRGEASQQALCGALVAPSRLPLHTWAEVYVAVCSTRLPSNAMFSYLSKFDMSRWSQAADTSQRTQVLEAMAGAAERWGAKPDQQHLVLIELLGVQSSALVTAREVGAHVCGAARRAARCTLPPAYCARAPAAARAAARDLSFDQIGHLLRELGVIWWEARKTSSNKEMYPHYATHFADVLAALLHAFVAAAVDMSYAPERVTLYAWSAMLESWSPWILPQSLPPLLPSTFDDEMYTTMLQRFVACIQQVMEDYPGSAEPLLCEVWRWSIETHAAVSGVASPQEARVQLSALLCALSRLHWRCQWYSAHCLPLAVQISNSSDREITSWCSVTLNHTLTDTWLHGVLDQHLAPTLANLFALFTSSNMQFSQECLSQACGLPWWRLPLSGLEQLLDQYFQQHHNPAMPYHELPHFCIVLSATQLRVRTAVAQRRGASHAARCSGVSSALRAGVAPPLHAHLRAYVAHLLAVIAELVPHIEKEEGQLEDILSRTVVVLCMEPAAKIVLPVYLEWMTSSAVLKPSLSAVATLTALDYFLPLADRLAKAHLETNTTGWSELEARWSSSAWWEASVCIKRGGLHAAYGLLRATRGRHTPERLLDAMVALNNVEVHFAENEEIVALWICVACRLALHEKAGGSEKGEPKESGAEGSSGEEKEYGGVAREVINKWAADAKRSLLQVVALQAATPAPTHRHRALCRFAQCILSPSESVLRSFETSVTAVLGSTPGDVMAWVKTPDLKKLLRLANKLYPGKEVYFKEESEMADKYN
ncbi:uncharacterized protein LOC119837835 [Zerene cesonia]|uniref:uncharacterized protein LOC119837835 n=1 Tax=Zerene cesonia TaxID=33412 RepID=UPI0018E5A3EB|nr:uncharacterized protein LOC119837835 [Zerene cesonia]